MIKELRIENFAIIDQLELVFGKGLTTFTGETGAGKSILLDAIEALVGGRAEITMIRAGADRANLEAIFAIPAQHKKEILGLLEAEGLLENENEILFNREIRRGGRNIARLNGRVVTVSLMREIGRYMVDIHGQSEHLSLLTVRQHLRLLDRFANNQEHLNNYCAIYQTVKKVRGNLAELRKAEQDAARQTDLLKYQIQEIEAAIIQPGEEDVLRRELSRLANSEKLASLAQNAYALLEENSPDTPSVSEMLGDVAKSVHGLAQIDHDLENRLMEIVTKDLVEWNSESIRGFEDCKSLFESEFDRLTATGHKPKFITSDALGKWIVWNILGRAPQTDEECLLIRTIGIMVTHVFFDWWEK